MGRAPAVHPRLVAPDGSHSSQGRRRAAVAAGGLLFCLLPLFAFVAPASRWTPLELVGALTAIAVISYFGAAALKSTKALDAAFIAALLALVFLGPVPAALIWIASEVGAFFAQGRRLDAFVVNAASFASAVLAAALVVAPLLPDAVNGGTPALDYAAIALGGLVMIFVNFLVVALLFDVLRMGYRNGDGLTTGYRNSSIVSAAQAFAAVARRELIKPAPATLAMIAIGTLTALAYAEIGILALALFAALVLVPQIVLPLVLRPRPVSELAHGKAVELYGEAIGEALKLKRRERLVLKDAAQFIHERPLCPRDGVLSDLTDGHRLALVEAVLYYREHWDGHDGIPGAVAGDMIPLTSRVLAVADAWSRLTSEGSPRLTHDQALNQLEARAGMHFDPKVVEAAIQVVEAERLGLKAPIAYQPRLHRIPLPGIGRLLNAFTPAA